MVELNELFDIEYGNQADLNKLARASSSDGVRFISRSSENLGFQCYVKKDKKLKVYKGGTITVTLGGTYVLSSFVQPDDYYTGQNIKVLTPKVEMSDVEKYFYCFAIASNRYRYTSHGREANKTLDNLLVPDIDEIPEWVYEDLAINSPSVKAQHNKLVSLEDRNWGWFFLKDIFPVLQKCKCTNATVLLSEGDDIYYIGAKKTDNGVMQKVKMVNGLVSKGNAMVFIGDGAGSVGYATYQEDDFIGSSTLTCGYSAYLNKYTGLFLVTILDLERYRFSFGRKYGKRQIENMKIKLPSTPKGEPDWQFMEYYIKSLPYSSNLERMSKDNKGLTDSQLIEKYESGKINLKEATKKMLQPSPTATKSQKQTIKKR